MKYFDYAATCPLDKDSADVYTKLAIEYFGNTSSLHDIGGHSAQLLENCRSTCAKLLGIEKNGLYYTSGGTESNFLAIEALLSAPLKSGKHIITSMAEHSSIHGTLKRLERDSGYKITYLPFTPTGTIDLADLQAAIRNDTVLITIQYTNSEIGTIQPIEEVAKLCQEQKIHFHSDFVQAIGKKEISKLANLVSSFSFSSHKFYGPKGVGGLYIKPTIHWKPFFPGTSHESGIRPGTLNLPAIAAMTVALEKTVGQMSALHNKYSELRAALTSALHPISEKVTIHGSKEETQYPGIIGLSIDGVEGQWLMLECNRLGFAISTGSACQAGMQTPSKTMQALGLSGKKAKEFARISFGNTTTLDDVEKLGQQIVNIVHAFSN